MSARRLSGGLALLAVGATLLACSPSPQPTPPGESTVPSATPSPSTAAPTPSEPLCVDLVDAMGQSEQIAQLFMLGIDIASGEVDSSTLNLMDDTGVGNVLLLGNSELGVAGVSDLAQTLRNSSPQPGGVDLMIATDQEGGQVQRLQGTGFPDMPSAAEQAQLSDAELRSRAEEWGEALKQAGVDYNLAPVADVVPADRVDSNEPIGVLQRGYGSDPEVVKEKAQAFVNGMHDAEIATSVKHFPGLGLVEGNTDLEADVTDTETTAEDLQTFTGYENLSSVMVSSAVYTQMDPDHPAVYSREIVTGTLRIGLAFDKVIISDDLGIAESAAAVDEVDRGAAFLAAGGDLVINADPDSLAAMMEGVRRRAAEDPGFATTIPDKATRVLELKAETGRAKCQPGRQPASTPEG
ncbi:glycoside hydrolase family 3 N-terminal domain-containing protein [Naumannella halotolerans]|uniref:glycoside hydrolase family 3 N-terminal domain-containing protein n=1 Tax=Naumannella halotolerans TaxID=993414 RepID=UPI00370D4235